MALPDFREIVDLVRKGLTLEAQEKIMELREAALEFQVENLALKDKVKELEATLALRDSLVWANPYYVKKEKQDEKFCQRCYDSDGKAIRLQELETGYWRCLRCENSYLDSDYEYPSGDLDARDRNPTTGY